MAADRMLADGSDIKAVCRHIEVSEATYHRPLKEPVRRHEADDA